MLSTKPYEPHTPSGQGATIADRSFLDFSVHELEELIDTYRWLVFKEHPLSVRDVFGHLGKFGRLVQNDRRENGELLLLDNRRTLHGREAFQGQRSLVNIQVLADT
jgi:hypothetical protein